MTEETNTIHECDVCGRDVSSREAHHDADVDWASRKVGDVRVLCRACVQDYEVVVRDRHDGMTRKQRKVLETLRAGAGRYMTPTEIGLENGCAYEQASRWAWPALPPLEQRGLAVHDRETGQWRAATWAGSQG